MLARTKIGIALWLTTPGPSSENLTTALEAIRTLADAGCDLVLLPPDTTGRRRMGAPAKAG